MIFLFSISSMITCSCLGSQSDLRASAGVGLLYTGNGKESSITKQEAEKTTPDQRLPWNEELTMNHEQTKWCNPKLA